MDVKPGWKTTEFWTMALANLAAIVGMVAGFLPAEWAAIALAVVDGLYAIGRGLAKHNPKQDVRDEVLKVLAEHGARCPGGLRNGSPN